MQLEPIRFLRHHEAAERSYMETWACAMSPIVAQLSIRMLACVPREIVGGSSIITVGSVSPEIVRLWFITLLVYVVRRYVELISTKMWGYVSERTSSVLTLYFGSGDYFHIGSYGIGNLCKAVSISRIKASMVVAELRKRFCNSIGTSATLLGS